MRTVLGFGVLALLLILLSLAYLTTGSYSLPLGEVVSALLGNGGEETGTVVLEIRLPRLLGALMTGAALSLTGAVMQSIFNNPLVSPDILGVSSGAACGAAAALVLGLGAPAAAFSSFAGGMLAVTVALLLARMAGGGGVLLLVLAGIVVAAFFSGVVELICALNPRAEEFPSILFFLFGSMARMTQGDLAVLVLALLPGALLLWRLGFALDVMSLGEADAAGLGLPAGRLRLMAVILCSVICGLFISRVGIIGWVGLVVPHLARIWFGFRHRILLPASMLLGAVLLVGVDLICRSLFTYELPLGVITSILGAPVFAVVLCRNAGRRDGTC